ncbi:MAG: cell division protein FtsK [Legionellales bacterium]|jgi:DNA segregation ATPase FtsK/SpoIIIE, S-DNA-T family|nr:cell division protein FtsK [Legionellales bacterium]
MLTKRRNKAKPEATTDNQRFGYLLNIIVIAVAVFTAIALFSYNHNDAGFTKSFSEDFFIANLEGMVGAWIADFLFYFFGISAFLIPFVLCGSVWAKSKFSTYNINVYTIIGALLFLVSLNGLCSLHLTLHTPFPSGIGGALGEYVAWRFVEVLNILGATFVLLTISFCSLVLIKPDISLNFILNLLKVASSKIKFNFLSILSSLSLPNFFKNTNKTIPGENLLHGNTANKQNIVETISDNDAAPHVELSPAEPSITIATTSNEDLSVTKKPVMSMMTTASHFSRVEMPKAELLDPVEKNQRVEIAKSVIINLSKDVEKKFLDFGIKLDVVAVYPGPVVTRFELKLAPGTKVSSISNLSKDLARTLSVTSVRIVDVIPGKAVIGLEIPNTKRQIVRLRDLISSNSYSNALSAVTIILGKDISGHPVVVDLAKMPHLLVAGTTGSGKSVGLNAMLLSFLYKSSCDDLRLILIDPKMLELSVYDDIPHLLTPVITDMGEAAGALRWCVAEMERRYKLMSVLGVRNIAGYNSKVEKANKEGCPLLDPLYVSEEGTDAPPLETLPAIVVVADEYADMIMVLGKKVEQLIARLAQKARAAGIHLVLATQRPSVNVVTGLIKANIPTRIAFQVSSRIDSRTVLDQQGAEQLLGHGDMLYLPPGTGVPVRVHGAYVSDEEVHRVVKFIKDNNPPPQYVGNIIETIDLNESDGDFDSGSANNASGEQDPLYDEAVAIVAKTKKASISSIQRKLKIGYNRSANIVEAMEKAGVVSAPSHNGSREVLVSEIKN